MVEPTDAEDPATKFRVGGVAEIGAGAVAFLLADGASKAGLGEGPAPSLAATPAAPACGVAGAAEGDAERSAGAGVGMVFDATMLGPGAEP